MKVRNLRTTLEALEKMDPALEADLYEGYLEIVKGHTHVAYVNEDCTVSFLKDRFGGGVHRDGEPKP